MAAQSAARKSTRFMVCLLHWLPALRRPGRLIAAAPTGLAPTLRAKPGAAWRSHAGGAGVLLRRPSARKCVSARPATFPVSGPFSGRLRPDPDAPDASSRSPLPGRPVPVASLAMRALDRWPRSLHPLRSPRSLQERLRPWRFPGITGPRRLSATTVQSKQARAHPAGEKRPRGRKVLARHFLTVDPQVLFQEAPSSPARRKLSEPRPAVHRKRKGDRHPPG